MRHDVSVGRQVGQVGGKLGKWVGEHVGQEGGAMGSKVRQMDPHVGRLDKWLGR